MAAALREIQEETSLTLTNMELLREGRPYTISDDKLKQEFRIYPYAWKLKGWNGGEENEDWWKDRMILNDENTGVVFFRLEDLFRMKNKVPDLEKGVRAVLEEE
jgi:8-oxo-dGTP pyrophosphatase MutT (NUDIX family)